MGTHCCSLISESVTHINDTKVSGIDYILMKEAVKSKDKWLFFQLCGPFWECV